MSAAAAPSGARRALDALNFFLADVRDGLGPYLSIYLLTVRHWDQASIGLAIALGGVATILAQTPAGALIDRTTAKKALLICAAGAVTAGSVGLVAVQGFAPVAALQILSGAAAAVFPPAIAAITLGIFGMKGFAGQIGRNESWNHGGNAFAAVCAGVAAYFYGPVTVFWLMGLMAAASIAATLAIPGDAIDHARARGMEGEEVPSSPHPEERSGTDRVSKDSRKAQETSPSPFETPPSAAPQGEGSKSGDHPSGIAVLLGSRPLLIFAVSAVLFHFANAAMLPLVGQKLAAGNAALGVTLTSVCIVAAQLVMIPVAWLVGRKADAWGRKPIFAVALGVLALRGALYPVSDSPYWLVPVQALDGVGAGIFGALFPVVISDLTKGTGRFNVSQGAIATAQGVGAALSNAVAGVLVVKAGYGPTFLALAGVAAAGLAFFWVMMPETRERT